jgi:hypothetical protein
VMFESCLGLKQNGTGNRMQRVRPLPEMPAIGRPESYYARLIHQADKYGDLHLHESAKVGQYITLGMDPRLSWSKRLKYFDHAIRRHCNAPPLPDDDVWVFYQSLGNFVRQHAGEQALRLALSMDEEYAQRLAAGHLKQQILLEARTFFYELMTLNNEKPGHFLEEDWAQLKLIRDQWV